MSWSLDTSSQSTYGATAPHTLSYTCGASAKLLVAVLFINGVTARTGGAPTYNGSAMTDSGSGFAFDSGGECGVEVWYLIDPSTGSAYDISVPNTGSVNMQISAMSFVPSLGGCAKDQNNSSSGTTQNPSVVVNSVGANALMIGALGSGDRDIPGNGTNYTLVHTYDAGNQTWGSEYDLDTGGAGNITVDFTTARADDWGLIGLSFIEQTGPSNLTVQSASVQSASSNPVLTQEHNLSANNASVETTLSTVTNTNIYTVADTKWFFSPGNWYKNGSSYAISNNPGAYSKFKFNGTGLILGIDLTNFNALGRGATDYPYLKWKVDSDAFQEQITTNSMTSITLASGLSPGEHTIEVYYESTYRAADRWNNPSVSIAFDYVEITAGELLSPTTRTRRAVAFGDSITEGVNVSTDDYSNAGQAAGRTWSIQLGETTDTEVGAVGFVSQGWTTKPVASHNISEFHKTDGTQTWSDLFLSTSRSFSGIDDILVAIGTNDAIGAADEATMRSYIQDFLTDFRALYSGINIYLIVPFYGGYKTSFHDAYVAYQTATPDNKCFIVDISHEDATLQEDIDGDGAGVTYSVDGLHPNQAGHDRIAELMDVPMSGTTLIIQDVYSETTSSTPTLSVDAPALSVDDGSSETFVSGVVTTLAPKVRVTWLAFAIPQSASPTLNVDNAHVETYVNNVLTTKSDTLVVSDSSVETFINNILTTKSDTLVVSDSYVETYVNNVILTTENALSVDSAFVETYLQNIVVTTEDELVVESTSVTTFASNVITTKSDTLSINDSYVETYIESVLTTKSDTLIVSGSSVETFVSELIVNTDTTLSVLNTSVSTFVDNIDTTKSDTLVVSNSYVETFLSNIDTTKSDTLVVSSLFVETFANEVALTGLGFLEVSNTYVETTIDNVSTTKSDTLSIDNTYVETTTDNVQTTYQSTLSVNSVYVETTSDSIDITKSDTLVVNPSSVITYVSETVLTLSQTVSVQGVYSETALSEITLEQSHNLSVSGSYVSDFVDSFSLASAYDISPDNSSVVTYAENVTVTEVPTPSVPIDDSNHAHTVDGVTITQNHQLTIADSAHAHTVDGVGIVQNHQLTISDTLHDHYVDGVTVVVASIVINNTLHALYSTTMFVDNGEVVFTERKRHYLGAYDRIRTTKVF